MKVSIVTVVYNNPLVGEALDSIRAQTTSDELEIIVIDGGSSESTLREIDRRRSDIAYFVTEKDEGIYDAMNKGFRAATGDIIGILNSDDLYFDQHSIQTITSVFRQHDIDAVYGNLIYVKSDDPTTAVRYWNSNTYKEGLFEKGWMPPHPTFFAKSTVYQTFGTFDTTYKIAADWELMVRLIAKHRIRTLHIPQTLVRMRLGGASNQSLRNIIRGNLESYRACKANGLNPPIWFPIQKPLSKLHQFVTAKAFNANRT